MFHLLAGNSIHGLIKFNFVLVFLMILISKVIVFLVYISTNILKCILRFVYSYYFFLNSHNLCNTCQSACRAGHSTETALLKVVNDMFLSLSKGNIYVLALLDFSSAFDTIDHPIRLHTDFGFIDTVLQ